MNIGRTYYYLNRFTKFFLFQIENIGHLKEMAVLSLPANAIIKMEVGRSLVSFSMSLMYVYF